MKEYFLEDFLFYFSFWYINIFLSFSNIFYAYHKEFCSAIFIWKYLLNQEKYLKKIVEFCLLNLYLSLFYAEDLLNNLQKIFGPILAKTITLESI